MVEKRSQAFSENVGNVCFSPESMIFLYLLEEIVKENVYLDYLFLSIL